MCVLSHAPSIIEGHFYAKQENEYTNIIYCLEFTLFDHFSHLKAGHLSWLFIFNSLYYYQKERKQLLGEYPLRGSDSPCVLCLGREARLLLDA